MSLIPWSPFLDTFENLETGLTNFMPAMDVYEDKDNVIVETTLAGIDPKNVDISVKDDVFYIEGKREENRVCEFYFQILVNVVNCNEHKKEAHKGHEPEHRVV